MTLIAPLRCSCKCATGLFYFHLCRIRRLPRGAWRATNMGASRAIINTWKPWNPFSMPKFSPQVWNVFEHKPNSFISSHRTHDTPEWNYRVPSHWSGTFKQAWTLPCFISEINHDLAQVPLTTAHLFQQPSQHTMYQEQSQHSSRSRFNKRNSEHLLRGGPKEVE